MAWPRIALALAFAVASVLATVAPLSARDSPGESRMEMNMAMDAMMDKSAIKHCKDCAKTSSIPECVSMPCGLSMFALPSGSRFNLIFVNVVFDLPADQEIDGPIYSPDPYPPKS